MKRLLLLIVLLGVLSIGCSENEELNLPQNPTETPGDNATTDDTPIFTIGNDGAIIVNAEGGEVEIAVTTNVDYTIAIPEQAQSWLSVEYSRADVREETLTVIVAENDSFEERSAEVELLDAEGEELTVITLTQKCYDKVFYTDTNGNYTVVSEGGEVEVAVTTNFEYSVVIPKRAKSWLSVADTRATLREETLTFIFAENDSFEERSAEVELLDLDGEVLQTITFTQSGQSKIFETLPGDNSIIPLADNGCEIEIFVTTNMEYSVVIADEAQSWLSVADTRVSLRDEIVTIVVAENNSYVGRSADVVFVDSEGDGEVLATITIVQDGAMLPEGACPLNEIWYTNGSTTEPTEPSSSKPFNVNILSNTYDEEQERWVIELDGIVTEIRRSAFSNCTTLSSIIIPDGVASIGSYAFCGCKNLTSVTIGSAVTSIGFLAFDNCNNLSNVYCNPATPPETEGEIGEIFRNVSWNKFIIFVPTDSLESYQSEWSDYEQCITYLDRKFDYEIGDLTSDGIVFYYDANTTKVVSLEGMTSVCWCVEDVVNLETNATDTNDGMYNMNMILSMENWEYKFPIFKWCVDLGEGWYIPSLYELYALIQAKDAINDTLVANGYAALEDGYYWSSTDAGGSYACVIELVDCDMSISDKDRSKHHNARAILAL